MFINWRNTGEMAKGDTSEEKVSINHVDYDGNTAIHLAASNNLLQCVSILISNGAIISIVNRYCYLTTSSSLLTYGLIQSIFIAYLITQCYPVGMQKIAAS